MTLLEENLFARSDDLPSWFANAIQKRLSVGADQFEVVASDATHVQIPAGAGDQAAIISIAGLWRWSESTIGPVAHPGGAAGVYPVFVTCKNNSIVSTPLPFTDNTDRSFALQVKAPGTTPTIVAGTVDNYRHVADVEWDGAQITQVIPIVPSAAATKLSPWVPASAGNFTVADRHAITAAGGSVVNLPNCNTFSELGQLIEVACDSSVSGTSRVQIVAFGGAFIKGRGLPGIGSTSIFLGSPGATVWLLAEAINVWRVVAGEVDSGWLQLGSTANTAISAQARQRGDKGEMRGTILITSGTPTTLGSIPNTITPSATRAVMLPYVSNAGAWSPVSIQIAPSGAITSPAGGLGLGTLYVDKEYPI